MNEWRAKELARQKHTADLIAKGPIKTGYRIQYRRVQKVQIYSMSEKFFTYRVAPESVDGLWEGAIRRESKFAVYDSLDDVRKELIRRCESTIKNANAEIAKAEKHLKELKTANTEKQLSRSVRDFD